MNTRTFAAFVIGLSAATFAAAQNGTLRATIPFNFVVNGKTLPAGEYSVQPSASLGSLIIKGVERPASVISLTVPVVDRSSRPVPRLVFHVYGDRYFLSEAWSGDQGTKLTVSHSEREIARKHTVPSGVAAIREVVLHK
jgi:hypothetical protein